MTAGYKVRVITHEPVSMSPVAHIANVTDTHAHVPGTVLRGALAARWMLQHGTPDHAPASERQEFLALFEGALRFGPLLAAGSAVEPLHVRRCKYRTRAECHAFVVDEAALTAGAADQRVVHAACEHCAGPLEQGKGRLEGVHLVETSHVALTPEETAKPHALFSRRALPAGSTLEGEIHGQLDGISALAGDIWLGGRRSIAGQAEVTFEPVEFDDPPVRLDGLVHIVLASPGIFVDECGRPVVEFPLSELQELLGKIEVLRSFVRPGRVSGWHAASRLPKPSEWMVVAGSSVLVQPAQTPTKADLARIEANGLGLRGAEGFGWVRVNPAPWSPRPVVPPILTQSIAATTARTLSDSGAQWVLQHLKETLLQKSSGRWTLPTEPLLTLRKFRELNTTDQGAIKAMLDFDIGSLDDAMAVMELRVRRQLADGAGAHI